MNARRFGEIAIEPVERFEERRCPACGQSLQGMRYEDEDIIEEKPQGIERARLDAHMLCGVCPACGETLYTVDITMVSDPLPGYALFNDHHWSGQGPKQYIAHRFGRSPWDVAHFTNVKGVSFYKATEGEFPQAECVENECRWLDLHLFGPLYIVQNPWDMGKRIVNTMARGLLAITWEKAGRRMQDTS